VSPRRKIGGKEEKKVKRRPRIGDCMMGKGKSAHSYCKRQVVAAKDCLAGGRKEAKRELSLLHGWERKKGIGFLCPH